MEKKLSIGFAHFDDYHGAWFTIQDIRKELIFNGRQDLLDQIEFVVIESNNGSRHASDLRNFCASTLAKNKSLSYMIKPNEGTSSSRNEIFKQAKGDFVLVMDCHVLLCPVVDTIEKIFEFIETNPETNDIFSGPLVYDDGINISTHFSSEWRSQMWGTWQTARVCECKKSFFDYIEIGQDVLMPVDMITRQKIDKCENCDKKLPVVKKENYREIQDAGIRPVMADDNYSFPIFAQGLGCFLVRREAWLGFNPHCSGFGGEECYIHEKYRQSGFSARYLPFLKWLHRFGRPDGPQYPLKTEYKVRNYILEFTELNLDLSPIKKHFVEDGGFDETVYNSFVREAKYLYNKE